MLLLSFRGAAVAGVAALLTNSVAHAASIALDSPAPLVGNQAFGGTLGMDFGVGLTPVRITRVGAFDSGQDGFANEIKVRLYNRDNLTPVLSESLAAGPTGTLINGSRFITPAAPLTLPAGFRGSIVAEGYSAAEPLFNSGGTGVTSTINTGGGALHFTGSGRFGTVAGGYPDTADGGPANRYHAGTFEFEPVGPVFRMAYDVNPGLIGNQNFGGSLGMDFDVGAAALLLTHLGVFDSGGDGLAQPINAYIYNRDTQLPVFGPLTFSGSGDLLVNGSRWKDIADFTLPAGFHGSVVADGYGASELLYNSGLAGAQNPSFLDDGNGALTFVGAGRFGNPGAYPAGVDGGPANRYGAGTFAYTVVPEPSSALCAAAGGAILVLRRRR